MQFDVLSDIFNQLSIWGVFDDLRRNALTYVFTFMAGTLSTYLLRNMKLFKAGRKILSGKFNGHLAVTSATTYARSGDINPKTGRAYYDQRIRTIESHTNLRKIFNPNIEDKILQYLDEATKHCTPEEPIVFQHLDKVIPEKDYIRTRNLISSQWANYFSELLRPPTGAAIGGILDDKIPVEEKLVAVLTYEQGETKKQYRVFLLSPDQLDSENFPPEEDLRFSRAGQYVDDPNHHRKPRYHMMKNLAKILSAPLTSWLKDEFYVLYPTGEYESAALPVSAHPSGKSILPPMHRGHPPKLRIVQ